MLLRDEDSRSLLPRWLLARATCRHARATAPLMPMLLAAPRMSDP